MSRPRRTSLDPEWFEAGTIGEQTATTDVYFADTSFDSMALILQQFVEELTEPHRTAVQLIAMQGVTYAEAAALIGDDLDLVYWLGHKPGWQPDRKAVWRWTRRGLTQLHDWLGATEWAGILTDGRIPGTGPEPPA